MIDSRIRKNKEPDPAKLQLVLKRPEKDYFWNLNEPNSWDLNEFIPTKTLTLFISGWTTHYDSKPNTAMYDSHKHLDDANNFLVNIGLK